MTEDIDSIATADGISIETLIIDGTSGASPALLILPTIFGINSAIRTVARTWADRGFLVAVPDYFHRTIPGPLEMSNEGRKAALARWEALEPIRVIADLRCVRDHLLSLDACNGALLVLGLCAGGEFAFLASNHLQADVAVGYHPTHIDSHLDEIALLERPVSLHFGEADTLVPMDKVNRIRAAAAGNQHLKIFVYPEAVHGFTVPDTPSFQQAAAETSDKRTQELFAPFLGSAAVIISRLGRTGRPERTV